MNPELEEKAPSWSKRTKAKLYKRVGFNPTAVFIIRTLFDEKWLRYALLAVFLLGGMGGLSLLKIWTVTPSWVKPPVKISWLDRIQAWSLQRSAKKFMQSGLHEDAVTCWNLAYANNPGDADLLRGSIANHLKRSISPAMVALGAFDGYRLLVLTGTNQFDVVLVARLYEHCRLYEDTVQLFASKWSNGVPAGAEGPYLKALFHIGRSDELLKRLEIMPENVRKAPDIALYEMASRGLRGEPDAWPKFDPAWDAALKNPDLAKTARRLGITVYGRRQNLERLGQVIQELRAAEDDSFLDHLTYWALLDENGKTEQARELVRQQPRDPFNGMEAIAGGRFFLKIELNDEAVALLERALQSFARFPELWKEYAQALVRLKRWTDLDRLANQIRVVRGLDKYFMAYSYYLQGLAELRANRAEAAKESFNRIPEFSDWNPQLNLQVAVGLKQLGYVDLGSEIIRRLEESQRENTAYWLTVFATSAAERNLEQLFFSAETAYKLQSNSLPIINNYAVALLLTRTNLPKALELTERLVRETSGSLGWINYALALAANNRYLEAERAIARVPRYDLTDELRTSLYLAELEIAAGKGELAKARAIRSTIQDKFLFPETINRLNELTKR